MVVAPGIAVDDARRPFLRPGAGTRLRSVARGAKSAGPWLSSSAAAAAVRVPGKAATLCTAGCRWRRCFVCCPGGVIPICCPTVRDFRGRPSLAVGAFSGLYWDRVGRRAGKPAGHGHDATRVTYWCQSTSRFYAQATGHARIRPPRIPDYPRIGRRAIAPTTPRKALLLPPGNYNQWDLVPMIRPRRRGPRWRQAAPKPQHAVFFTNMGMLGMNVGLDVRVIDQIGLQTHHAQYRAAEACPARP